MIDSAPSMGCGSCSAVCEGSVKRDTACLHATMDLIFISTIPVMLVYLLSGEGFTACL